MPPKIQRVLFEVNPPEKPEGYVSMRCYVILVNWNGWRDTLECLESVFHLDYPDFRVVVCDNSSSDGSLTQIKAWAKGEIAAEPANPRLSHLISPPSVKPISWCELSREQAESNISTYNSQLALVDTGANLGFAGGNNVGLRYALADPLCQFVWMLNNDTIVEPHSLSALVQHMQDNPDTGLCGSLNLSYYQPATILCLGGKPYNRWTGRVRTPTYPALEQLAPSSPSIDYVNGASMLATRAFLERVGLMEEAYFLYFEELDWAMRAKGEFSLGYARDSVVYHKEGATIGSNRDRENRSLLSEQYLTRNRVLFTKVFFAWALPSVLVTISLTAAYWLGRGHFDRANLMLTSMLQGLKKISLTAGSRHRKGST